MELIILTQVFVCGDESKAKQRVMDIARTLGLTPLDQGSLVAAKEIENYPLKLFPMWRLPFYMASVLCVFFFVYCAIREVIYPYVNGKTDTTFRLAVSIPNRVFPVTALTLLALVYLPGVLAAVLQLYRGTKYRRFPNWLDHWMLCRKQLGLVALGFAFLHAVYTLVIPIRYYVRWRLRNATITQVSFFSSVFLYSLKQRAVLLYHNPLHNCRVWLPEVCSLSLGFWGGVVCFVCDSL